MTNAHAISVGDVFLKTPGDTLWKCIRLESDVAILSRKHATESVRVSHITTPQFDEQYKFVWNESNPGLVQATKTPRPARIYVLVNATTGPQVISTVPCTVIICDAEYGSRYNPVEATVGDDAAVDAAIKQFDEDSTPDPDFVADWIYDDLDSDQMCELFRKRGHRTAVIDAEDSCGDDTIKFFEQNVKVGDELIETTSNGWRIFRNQAEYDAQPDDNEGDEDNG
jgi:hypothetical protein